MTKPVRGFSWVTPAVYPLYAAVGVGVLAAVTIMSRKLTAVCTWSGTCCSFVSIRIFMLPTDVECSTGAVADR